MRCAALFIFLLFVPVLACAIDYERFELNGKVGIRDGDGHVVLPADFDALGWSDGRFSVIGKITGYRKKNKWGLLSLNRQFITQPEFESLTTAGTDRIVAGKLINPFSTKYGCLDLAGNVVIPFAYDEIQLNGLRAVVMVKKDVKYEFGLIDLSNKIVLPLAFKEITPLGSLRYAVKDFENKIALCNEDGKWVTGFVIDEISDFIYDFAIVTKGWKKGLIDRNGELRIQPLYRNVKITGPETAMVQKPIAWKIVDPKYKDLQIVEADDLTFELNGWTRIKINGKIGFVDQQFQPQWPAAYDEIGPLTNQMALAKKNGRWGLLKKDQTQILPFEFDSLCFTNNLVRACSKYSGRSFWVLYDTVGVKKTAKNYDYIGSFNGSFFPVKHHGFWGGVDRYGKEKIACVYDSLLETKDQLIAVRFKGQYGIITVDDQWRMMPQVYPISLIDADHFLQQQDSTVFLKDFAGNAIYFTTHEITVHKNVLTERLPDGAEKEVNLLGQIVSQQSAVPASPNAEAVFRESEGLIGIKRDGKFGFIDTRGRLRIANRYDGIGEFHDGLAPFKLLNLWGFLNQKDQIVIQPSFESTENFNNKIAVVSRSHKYGLINTDGKVLLDIRYDSIRRLADQHFIITQQNLKGLADTQGRILIEPRFEILTPVGESLVIVKRDGMFGVLTKDGLSVFPLQFGRLDFIPEKNAFLTKTEPSWETIHLK